MAMTFGCKRKTAVPSIEYHRLQKFDLLTVLFSSLWFRTCSNPFWEDLVNAHTHIATEKSKNCQRKHVQPSSKITPAELGICLLANSSTKRCLERLGISNWHWTLLKWFQIFVDTQPTSVNLVPFPKTWPASLPTCFKMKTDHFLGSVPSSCSMKR